MSKIGKKPIILPAGATIALSDNQIKIKGPLGEIFIKVLSNIDVKIVDKKISFEAQNSKKQTRSNWGTLRSLVWNAIIGVTEGFSKKLVLEGVGYRITKEGNNLNMSLGFSHPVKFEAPQGIVFEVEKNSLLTVKGFDKTLVGETAAKIRALKKPEPYKGKGFHYEGEVVRRKAGKKAATA